METAVKILAIVKDIVLIIATVIGAVVAIKGLKTWRDQIKGKTENELAKNILLTLYKYRNAIVRVRNPIILSNEIPSLKFKQIKKLDESEINYYDMSEIYNSRLSKLNQLHNELKLYSLESKVRWGDELEKLITEIVRIKLMLDYVVKQYLISINLKLPEVERNSCSEKVLKHENILFEIGEDKEFSDNLNNIITEIEDYLKPKLI